ncbi:MAG: ribbon-helix-helix protein, CopG family, partial [Marivivens sp.]|nr:ribbon-helix-helix protein, CopG family [Marivivens sp.]
MTEQRKRHLLSVTLKEDLYEQVKAQARKEDVPVTAWARRAILE